ncbi:CPBP family intramembrane glutamic endopeptidase [Luteimicrobium sp. NPDC057192]|uniref:CPBP family intramembrane glutamic endopeptidase n=1 Tax=Luteimicrobium sp. NPDC057192 TaxID=3346042 RepID=UPI00363DD7A3
MKNVVLRTVVQLAGVAAVSAVGNQVATALDGHGWAVLVVGLATAAAALVVYRALVRWTEHRAAVEVGPGGRGRGLAIGTGAGVAMFAVVIAVLALLGDYTVHGAHLTAGVAGFVGLMAAAAVTEELMFRGVLFRVLERGLGTWLALAATSVLFGALHLVNPDATWWGALAIAVEAGGMLGAAYVATRTLWLPIGLHFGWNFAESAIFSTAVSGNGASHGWLDATTSGSTLVTGGTFGPEAGLPSIVVCLAVASALLVVARRRGRIVPRTTRAGRLAGVDGFPAVSTLAR